MAGAAVFPPVLGLLFGTHGAGALAVALISMSVVAVAACLAVMRLDRGPAPQRGQATIMPPMQREANHVLT